MSGLLDPKKPPSVGVKVVSVMGEPFGLNSSDSKMIFLSIFS
jgi:hypothetical protein